MRELAQFPSPPLLSFCLSSLLGALQLVDGKVASKKEAKTARLAFQRLMGALLDKEPQDTELLHAKLHHLYARLDLPLGEADEERPGVRAALEDIVVAATSVVKAVDGDKIATGFGRSIKRYGARARVCA